MAKLVYDYHFYNGCPEATEISRSRSQGEAWLNYFIGLMSFMSLFSLLDLRNSWWVLLITIAFLFVYIKLFLPWRSKKTEKLIKEAIERRNIRWKEAITKHDTGTLVELKIHEIEMNNDTFKKMLDFHNQWLEKLPNGKRLVLFAEDISFVDLKGLCLDGVVFSHCRFYKMNMMNTRFMNCDMSYCEFVKLDLNNTRFINCNLSHSTFEKCKLKETDFSESQMIGTRLN